MVKPNDTIVANRTMRTPWRPVNVARVAVFEIDQLAANDNILGPQWFPLKAQLGRCIEVKIFVRKLVIKTW